MAQDTGAMIGRLVDLRGELQLVRRDAETLGFAVSLARTLAS